MANKNRTSGKEDRDAKLAALEAEMDAKAGDEGAAPQPAESNLSPEVPASNSIAGIEFAPPTPVEVTEEVAETIQRQQQAKKQRASDAITQMRAKAVDRRQKELDAQHRPGAAYTKGKVPQPTAEQVQEMAPKVYRVLQDVKLAKGASQFSLYKGKIIDENNYDIPTLVEQGVVLEEVGKRVR